MGFLICGALSLPDLPTLGEHLKGSVEDLLNRMESIAGEVAPDMALVWLGIVVALEVEDPEGIQVGMH